MKLRSIISAGVPCAICVLLTLAATLPRQRAGADPPAGAVTVYDVPKGAVLPYFLTGDAPAGFRFLDETFDWQAHFQPSQLPTHLQTHRINGANLQLIGQASARGPVPVETVGDLRAGDSSAVSLSSTADNRFVLQWLAGSSTEARDASMQCQHDMPPEAVGRYAVFGAQPIKIPNGGSVTTTYPPFIQCRWIIRVDH
jgi:hypothetical protein